MKYLVTGFPGSGKFTIALELNKASYEACSTDEVADVSQFVDMVTKKPISMPKNASPEWKLRHFFAWDPTKINESLSDNTDIFIYGLSHNQSDFYDKFDKIFVLTIDEPTMLKRLVERDTNYFGKHPAEIKHLLKLREKVQSNLLKNKNAIALDSTQPLKKVVTEILGHIK